MCFRTDGTKVHWFSVCCIVLRLGQCRPVTLLFWCLSFSALPNEIQAFRRSKEIPNEILVEETDESMRIAMNRVILATTILMTWTTSSRSEVSSELVDFAQLVCNSIPRNILSKTSIQAKVEANADVLTKIITGAFKPDKKTIDNIYNHIPFNSAPDNITGLDDCKLWLSRLLVSAAGQEVGEKPQPYTDSITDYNRGVELTPVRRYLSAKDIPPPGVGAYGIVALISKATSANRIQTNHGV